MRIKEKVESIKERIADAQLRSGNKSPIKIVAITKAHPASLIVEAWRGGLDTIGENRVQEAEDKFFKITEILPKITKRLVGHLQSNKINKALNIFDTIDSVDSLKLAGKIGRKAVSLNRTIPVLLEVNTSGESTKFGFTANDIDEMLACFEIQGIELRGLMTVGPLTSDKKRIRDAFNNLRELHNSLKSQLTDNVAKFTELSMGMSSDFEIAVEEGATMVRLGTVLFGQRIAKG
ncbi:MAG: YggS family pyridoxal phosphate-dependent enzyme [Candidatus Neomarinimicrobiota bacterium]